LREEGAESRVTNYFAALLNAVASLALALLMPTFLVLFRDLAAEHAPGLTVVASGMLESLFSLRFGILFLLFFSGFYLARRSSKPGLRILLFWIPASLVTALGFSLWAGLMYWMLQMQRF
jgi:hypothetical protein